MLGEVEGAAERSKEVFEGGTVNDRFRFGGSDVRDGGIIDEAVEQRRVLAFRTFRFDFLFLFPRSLLRGDRVQQVIDRERRGRNFGLDE
jgi:hypothetical protein